MILLICRLSSFIYPTVLFTDILTLMQLLFTLYTKSISSAAGDETEFVLNVKLDN